jgi:signal transduction histidine kinase
MLFRTQLLIAFAAMGLLALAQGGFNAWISHTAELQVLRGRVAGDLQSGFLDLSATKQRLRAWSLRVLIGADHEAGDGELLRTRMAETIARLQQLSREAERLDGSVGRTSQDDERRNEALRLLAASVVALRPAIATITAQGNSGNILAAWAAIETVFDQGAGRDLRQVLNESIRTETDLLARRREDADRALAGLNLLSLTTTVLLGLAALGLAAYFARALRRPLHDLVRGAEAFATAELDHRIPVRGRNEFAGVATSINRMAQELSLRRDQEARIRGELEGLVAERTAALEEALDGLRQSERRRRQLLGEISHELRTPMAAIRGEAEVTLRGARSEADYRAALTRVGQASQQLAALIDDLIMMARSDGETLPLDQQPVDARLPLEEALVTVTSAAQQRQIRLETDVEAPATLFCDPVRLQQIITLLLDNAVRYSHPGGTVRVTSQVKEDGTGLDHWRLDIVDQGIGIAPDDLDRVFERTYRAGNARGHRPNGMGLGLAIARHLAERQEGTIDLDSRLGDGTTVTLRFPILGEGRVFPREQSA